MKRKRDRSHHSETDSDIGSETKSNDNSDSDNVGAGVDAALANYGFPDTAKTTKRNGNCTYTMPCFLRPRLMINHENSIERKRKEAEKMYVHGRVHPPSMPYS